MNMKLLNKLGIFDVHQEEPMSQEEYLKNKYSNLVQKWLDDFAKTKLYDNANSCISYRDSVIPHYKEEAERMSLIRDKWWDACVNILNDITTGDREMPTEEELWNELNSVEPMEW